MIPGLEDSVWGTHASDFHDTRWCVTSCWCCGFRDGNTQSLGSRPQARGRAHVPGSAWLVSNNPSSLYFRLLASGWCHWNCWLLAGNLMVRPHNNTEPTVSNEISHRKLARGNGAHTCFSRWIQLQQGNCRSHYVTVSWYLIHFHCEAVPFACVDDIQYMRRLFASFF